MKRKEGQKEGRKKKRGWEEESRTDRRAGGKSGRKFGHRHHFCTNILLPPGDRAKTPSRAASSAPTTPLPCHSVSDAL